MGAFEDDLTEHHRMRTIEALRKVLASVRAALEKATHKWASAETALETAENALAGLSAALEVANARIAELVHERACWMEQVEYSAKWAGKEKDRAVRAETECKAMRDWLLWVEHKGPMPSSDTRRIVRAALNYSSVDKAVDTKETKSYIIFKGD